MLIAYKVESYRAHQCQKQEGQSGPQLKSDYTVILSKVTAASMRNLCKCQVCQYFLCFHVKQYRAGFNITLCTGLASTFNMQQLIEEFFEGSDTHILQNTSLHTDDWRLRKDADRLMRRGFVDLMKEELPYQCALVMHLEWILSNASGLTR